LKDFKNVKYVLGQHRPENFIATDMVIKNPAAPWSNKYVKLALDKKIPVEMDSSLFFKLCKNTIIGVTGTKGKTTTTTLICEILKMAGKNPLKVGIGQTSVLDKLKDLKKDSVVVFELSSWRLSALGRSKLSPKIAVITNIYPDHLNYYKSMKEYVQDKKYIFLHQKKENCCVISSDNEIVKELESEIGSRLIKFSKKKIASGRSVYLDKETIYFNDGIDEKKILEAKDIGLMGEHNLENVLAAVSVALECGISPATIKKAVSEFRGVAHRLELVREAAGVKYYNDSAATTPEAAIAGINSFFRPVILICGGSDKNLNMAEFGKIIAQRAKGVVFLKGAATDKIISAMKISAGGETLSQNFQIVESMEKAVELAKIDAQEGDVVLLSPGATSFGTFKNEFDRGDKFKEAVNALK
jgi:UDP-N-acetylmuramoylalanine--D-glutamate ligase